MKNALQVARLGYLFLILWLVTFVLLFVSQETGVRGVFSVVFLLYISLSLATPFIFWESWRLKKTKLGTVGLVLSLPPLLLSIYTIIGSILINRH